MMISRNCQNSRLHVNAFCSSKDTHISTEFQKTIYGKTDGKKCAYECWLPDNCSQTAIKFRTTAVVGSTLSDMKWKRNLVHSSRNLLGSIKGDISKHDANGAETDNIASHARSVSQVMRSRSCGQTSIRTRFSVHCRSCKNHSWKDTSSRYSLPFTSSYCSVLVARNMQKHLTCEHITGETIKPAQRFSLLRTNSRREPTRMKPGVNAWHSSLPSNCSRQPAKCDELQLNLYGRGSSCNAINTLPVYPKNTANTNIQAAIAHTVTESLQAGYGLEGDISKPKSGALLPEELHLMKTDHANQEQCNTECFWNKLFNGITPSDIQGNLSVVKLRQMAGKLIESLICKIKLQLDSGSHPLTGELECATNKAHKLVEPRHCTGTKQCIAQGKCATNDCKHFFKDTSESKHRRRHATEKEKALTVVEQANKLVNQNDMQPVVYISTDMKNESTKDQQHGLKNKTEHLTTSARTLRSDNASMSMRTFNFEMALRSRDSQSIEENRGAHNDKSSLTNSITTASDYEESSDDEEEEIDTDISLQSGSYQSTSNAISDMKVGRQKLSKHDRLLSTNDYIVEAVLPQPLDPNHASEPSSSLSETPLSSSPSTRKRSEPMQSVPSSSSSIRKEPEPTSLAPNSSSSIQKKPDTSSSVPSSSLSIRKEFQPKLEVVYNTWETKEPTGNDAVIKKHVEVRSSPSILSTMENIEETFEHATLNPETEATLKNFASEVVQSLYTAIRYKLKSLVQDSTDEAKKLEIMQRGDTELRNQILPTIIEHIIWIIKEEFRGQDEAKWKRAIMHDPGQYLDTIVTNAVMKTHADRMRQRSFLKTFVVTSNFKQSASD